MQITIANETDLSLVFDDETYRFNGGRFWTSPGNIAANSESTFSVCNKKFGVGVEGRVTYRLVGPKPSCSIVVSCVNKLFGDIQLSAGFEENGGALEKTLNIDGTDTKICISYAPGNEGRITLFYGKEKKPSQLVQSE